MNELGSASQQPLCADVVHSDAEQPTHSQAAEDVDSSTDEGTGLETLVHLTDQLTADCGE